MHTIVLKKIWHQQISSYKFENFPPKGPSCSEYTSSGGLLESSDFQNLYASSSVKTRSRLATVSCQLNCRIDFDTITKAYNEKLLQKMYDGNTNMW